MCLSDMLSSISAVENDDHTGRTISCTIPNTVAKVQHLISEDQHQTIQDLTDEVRSGYGACQEILTHELGMQHTAAKFCLGSSMLSISNTVFQFAGPIMHKEFVGQNHTIKFYCNFCNDFVKKCKTMAQTLATRELAAAS